MSPDPLEIRPGPVQHREALVLHGEETEQLDESKESHEGADRRRPIEGEETAVRLLFSARPRGPRPSRCGGAPPSPRRCGVSSSRCSTVPVHYGSSLIGAPPTRP